MKMGENAYPGNGPADSTSPGSQMWNRGSEYSGVGTANGYIPPAGTSARKAFDKRKRQGGTGTPGSVRDRLEGNYDTPLNDAVDDILDGDKPRPPAKHGSPSGHSARETFEYYEAPISERYGFGRETAYQEALANTAYRREMDDMRKAGLNPSVIYGAHNSSGADTSIVPRSSGGGGGGGRGGRRYGRAAQKGISKTAYYGIQLGFTAAGAMLGGKGGAFLGAAVGRTAAQLIGSLYGK